jgi:hypothetical protein
MLLLEMCLLLYPEQGLRQDKNRGFAPIFTIMDVVVVVVQKVKVAPLLSTAGKQR